jgi:TPR repeat protein/formylglycine-generating enzyme required for sulfatase activity
VALKFLPEVVAGDPKAVDELREETRKARRLTHLNIVRIHQFERDETAAAVSMEFVDGTTLSKLQLAQPGKVFSVAKLAPLVAQLCAALDYAHQIAKVVHRDLKPANVMVTADGVLKVADFGIARSLSETSTRLTGKGGGTSGTLPYMSPQQVAGGKATPADDIYALGATLYELLTGKPPFYTGDITHQILQQVPASLAARRAELEVKDGPVPPAWEETILACLAKDPAQRPQSAGEVAARLGLAGAGGTAAGSSPVNGRRPATSASPTKSRMRRVPLLAGLAVLALGVLAYSYWPRRRLAPANGHFVPSTAKPVTAFDETKAKAERGDAVAQCNLGWMYGTGAGVPKDSVEAAKWYRTAADQGNAMAQLNVGWMYDTGNGVAKDSAEAAKWYRTAADQGVAEAQYGLGLMYANGDGVAKDSAEAAKWYRKAADQGYAIAQCNLGVMYGTGAGVPKDSAEAERWFRKAADQGNASGQGGLGVMYATGAGVPKDSAEAVKWFRKSADQGYAVSQHYLGLMYAKGDGVPKDETEALAWYYIAAASGNETAVKNRDALELSLGRQLSLAAQQRSKEILKEIEAAKLRSAGPVAVGAPPPKSSGSGAISAHAPDVGQAWTIPDMGLELVPIRAGEFTMGSPASESGRSNDEGPQTRVTITRAFWLGKIEVTQGQWEALMGRNSSHFKDSGPDAPVENVSWTDAMEFCRKLTEREQAAGRLPNGYAYTVPTEAQWEYACRAGTTGPYAGDLDAMAWYGHYRIYSYHDPNVSEVDEWLREQSMSDADREKMREKKYDEIKRARPQAVWQARANAWGLYNMHGNVWEWCLDRYGNYPGGSVTDPTGPSSGINRVRRGGSYDTSGLSCRSACRNGIIPNYCSDDLGFRLALAPTP